MKWISAKNRLPEEKPRCFMAGCKSLAEECLKEKSPCLLKQWLTNLKNSTLGHDKETE